MTKSFWGFDRALDATADATRVQFRDRLFAAVAVFLLSLQEMSAGQLASWIALFALGEILLRVATAKKTRRLYPVACRSLRLLSSTIAASAWATIASMWWLSEDENGGAIALALLCGVLVYIVRGCHRSLVHMIAVAAPLVVTFLAVPFLQPTTGGRVETLGAMVLLILFTASSAIGSWKAERQLDALTDGLREKQKEAAAANTAKSEFLANMSHEIRTPLNGIVAMAHMLRKADLPQTEKEAADLIAASGETLEALLSDILDTAKIESGRLTIEETPFHAGELVRSVAALLRLKADEKGVRLHVEIDPDQDRILVGDPTRLRQIVTNLLSNAVKFTAAGQVTVRLQAGAASRQRLSVIDTGVGFDPASKLALFERFQQADGSITRNFGGTGLGLSISRGLADAMGGRLDCDSTPGEGAKFWLDLDLPDGLEGATDQAQSVRGWQGERPLGILVADDHPTNRRVVELILGSAGIHVICVENGLQAVAATREQAFDLILMDMQMPVMDGLTAVRQMREHEAISGGRTPVLMLTANALPEHISAGQAAGADGHITKPFNPEQLLECIYATIAEAGEDTAQLATAA
jgi:signal transduction histidine kinase/AmiR/NasT family two-component response regulator